MHTIYQNCYNSTQIIHSVIFTNYTQDMYTLKGISLQDGRTILEYNICITQSGGREEGWGELLVENISTYSGTSFSGLKLIEEVPKIVWKKKESLKWANCSRPGAHIRHRIWQRFTKWQTHYTSRSYHLRFINMHSYKRNAYPPSVYKGVVNKVHKFIYIVSK